MRSPIVRSKSFVRDMRRPRYERFAGFNWRSKETLKQLPDKTVHTCITSPPYYGLRDYGTAEWEGGDPDCEHSISHYPDSLKKNVDRPSRNPEERKVCNKCGAIRTDSQIGLEDTPEEYVENLVEVFREVRRVLRDDGTLWLNLGDSYWGGKGASGQISAEKQEARTNTISKGHSHVGGAKKTRPTDKKHNVIKPKDLIGIPWMVALALRADGWYLRQDIIWHKPSCMPESVKDRCTNRMNTYSYYPNQSITIMITRPSKNQQVIGEQGIEQTVNITTKERGCSLIVGLKKSYTKRNKRSVWSVNPKPYSEAHFAVYPPKLIEPCVLAGCPKGGVVLDPFGGSGTTAAVALKHHRQAILCELNEGYVDLQASRIEGISGRVEGQQTLF